MNGYYTRENQYNGCTASRASRAADRMIARADRAADVLVMLLSALIGALRDRNVRTVIRYAVVAACFFGFVGLVGGIERGTMSLGGGVVLGLFLIFVEIYCLKP